MRQFEIGAKEAVERFAGGLVKQLVANEMARRNLSVEMDNRQLRTLGIWVGFLLSAGLSAAADFFSGPGDVTKEKGWPEWVLGISGFFALAAIGLGIWAAVDWYKGPKWEQIVEERENLDRGATRLREEIDGTLEAEWVRPMLKAAMATRLSPTFSSMLRVDDSTLFGGSPLELIETEPMRQLQELVTGVDGASIGLCGPRGVGKTTLITRVCRSMDSGEDGHQVVGIHVGVPVAYDQRDFLATIYSRLMDEVKNRVLDVRSDREKAPQRHRLWWRAVQLLIVAVVAALGLITRRWWLDQVLIGNQAPDWLRAAVIPASLALVVLVAASLIRVWRGRSRSANPTPDKFLRLRESIREGRLSLSADLTTSSSTGGSVAVLGTSLERSDARQVSRGLLSYPDLVERFRKFVAEDLAEVNLRVRIGIDELDKLETDDARSFLNSLKTIFNLPRTHFLVSVSEDAMSDFERRGLPIRDAFDSSLDEVVRIDELTIDQSMRLLSSRGDYEFPLSFGALCHCLSGGLPRELLRVARRLVRHNARLKSESGYGLMKPLCSLLIEDDLGAKSDALWVVARTSHVEPYSMRFRSFLAKSDETGNRPEQLLSTCEAYLKAPVVATRELAVVPEWLPALERLGSLALEFVGYRYFAATLLEFFSGGPTDADLRDAVTADAGTASLETLSAARARFADDPRLAWSKVSQFRRAHQLVPALRVPAEGWRLPSAGNRPISRPKDPAP